MTHETESQAGQGGHQGEVIGNAPGLQITPGDPHGKDQRDNQIPMGTEPPSSFA